MENTMNISEITSWVGFVVFGGGLYCLYSCIMMKLKGIINENLLLNKEVRFKKCKNKEAYIKEMFPSLLVFSIFTTICGGVDLINTFVVEVGRLYVLSLVLFIAAFCWFMVQSKKCRDRYY